MPSHRTYPVGRLTNIFISKVAQFVSGHTFSIINIGRCQEKHPLLEKLCIMLFRHRVIFWISLSLLLFGFFRWLFGIAMPEIALQFALGTTFILVFGLWAGNILTTLAIRTDAIKPDAKTVFLTAAFILTGFVGIAFLLNAMIEKTTFFPFAITILLLFLVTAAAGCLVTLLRHQYKTQLVSAHAAIAQSKSELQLLQSQLSPHFLFNTLNNLYGLSMTEPDRLPSLLLKLSELLRYSVYDVKEIFVPLQHEVDYIGNYLEFERLRLGNRLQLSLDFDTGSKPRCKIPPLMLIVFVENAFKHSRTAGEDAIRIHISLRKSENQIVFSIINSVASKSEKQHTEKHSGFGLENVRKRLDLLYAGRHTLTINKTESDYRVYLKLECQ